MGRRWSVFLDGSISWRVQSKQSSQYQPLAAIPAGTKIDVEVIPQPDEMITLEYEGKDVANFYDGLYSKSLHGAVSQARDMGYRVFAHAKRIDPRPEDDTISNPLSSRLAVHFESPGWERCGTSAHAQPADSNPNPLDSYLAVRSVLAADLLYWLASSPECQAQGYYELDWVEVQQVSQYLPRGKFQKFLQQQFLSGVHSRISSCRFIVAGRTESGTPNVFNVIADGKSIGQTGAYRNLADNSHGLARIHQRWSPDESQYVPQTEICVVQSDGSFPINTNTFDPFERQDQRRGGY